MIKVMTEETVATCEPPNNGADALWCYGAPLIVRVGSDVYASVMETGTDVPPLCNTRPRLYRKRGEGKWQMLWCPSDYREREPCPLIALSRSILVLSQNVSTAPAGTYYGPSAPRLTKFALKSLSKPTVGVPPFPENAVFTDHSYRGIAADSRQGEILLLHIDAQRGAYHCLLLKRDGRWSDDRMLGFPIRACYPQVILRNRAAYVLAVGAVSEPNSEWTQYKREKTQSATDWVWRRLFFTWTPDILSQPFATPIEVDNADSMGGHITNLDMWLDRQGVAHLLYHLQPTTHLIRDKFFPNMRLRGTLEYRAVKNGTVIQKQTLMEGGEGLSGPYPLWARFHSTDGKRLWVVYAALNSDGTRFNALLPLLPKSQAPIKISLQQPFAKFFTACERGGSSPSRTVDLFGVSDDARVLRYACFSV